MSLTISTLADRSVSQMFDALQRLLEKAEAAAKVKNVEDSVYLNWRVAADMHPMKTQVRFAMEAVRQLSLMAGIEAPEFTTDAESFVGLQENLNKSREMLKGLPAEALDSDPDAPITVSIAGNDVTMARVTYFQNFILPNLYFHTTATYLILRHLGVELGKGDYLFSGPLR